MRAALIAAAVLLLAPATAAAADVVIDGRGWGHGVGLSQYGAYGFALREGRDHRSILAHYYTGSGYDRAPATRTRARLVAPVTVTGGSSTVLSAAAENGLSGGVYRGRMVLLRDGGAVLAVNHVSLEHYLYGVVPAEMPAGWPAEALRAQAIIARSYALRGLRPDAT